MVNLLIDTDIQYGDSLHFFELYINTTCVKIRIDPCKGRFSEMKADMDKKIHRLKHLRDINFNFFKYKKIEKFINLLCSDFYGRYMKRYGMDRYFVSSQGWLTGHRAMVHNVDSSVIYECPYCESDNFALNVENDSWVTDCCGREVDVQQL